MRSLKYLVPLLTASLILSTHTHVPAATAAEIRIDTRIDQGLQWLVSLQSTSGQAYFRDPSSPSGTVNVAQTGIATTALVMYDKTHSSDRYDVQIKDSLNFILSMQNTTRGDFACFFDTRTGQGVSGEEMYYLNAYILEALAFSAFQLRIARSSTRDTAYYDTVISSVQACFDRLQKTYQESDGGWYYRYPGGDRDAELDANGMTLTALLYTATYLQLWGDQSKAAQYREWAENTKDWIMSTQGTDPGSWGYGGFYQNSRRDLQDVVANARGVFGLTTYLRLIDSLIDRSTAMSRKETIRSGLVLWEESFFREISDEFRGPHQARTGQGVTAYPKSTGAAAASMIAFVEIWVVHGDSKFLDWSKALYMWLTGENEGGVDLQSDARSGGAGFANGFTSPGVVDQEAGLEANALAVSALLYGNWIDIPEFRHTSSVLTVLLAVLVLVLTYRRFSCRNLRR